MEEKKTILVVDDMPQIRKILRFSLKTEGYNVILANSGKNALEEAFDENNSIDLILLDIMMPKMDGYEVIQHLREAEMTKEIPIIFLTAKAQQKDVIKGLEIGGNDYVVKPYKFDDLNKKIQKWLG
ncbi:MAG: response regulator [Desulfobacteraceae bacterium]|nr:response regulator [Desulfobacteraceae bacterium]